MRGKAKEHSAGGQLLRAAYHSARNLPDRMLHQRRHREARQRISHGQRPREILVVCYGNICRSPYLQAVLQRALPELVVNSAGFFGSDRAVPEVSLALTAKRGLDLSRFRSRPLTRGIVAGADLVIVMDPTQARQLRMMFPWITVPIVIAGDLDPQCDASRAIADPWNQSADVFESSFNRLDRCAATLVGLLARRG